MTTPTLNCQQVRELDHRAVREYGMSSLVLMENAGRGVADTLVSLGVAGPVVVCCYKGNNGGDGFVVARHLDLRGVAVKVALWCDPTELAGDAALNYSILAKSDVRIEIFAARHDSQRLDAILKDADWIVDALLGTGAAGDPRPPLAAVIDRLNEQGAPILAVDLPSGLDCDTGHASRHTIRARHTCTFVAQKPGFLIAGAEQYTGIVHVLDIGATRRLVEACLAAAGGEAPRKRGG
jgi:NAD(P)H-hydrate epimerase